MLFDICGSVQTSDDIACNSRIHGGSFETGDSQSDDEPAFAMEFATRGYAVVSINCAPPPPSPVGAPPGLQASPL